MTRKPSLNPGFRGGGTMMLRPRIAFKQKIAGVSSRICRKRLKAAL